MSSAFSAKKLLLLGFVVIILVAIPVSVYILQQQQKTKSFAAASTHLFFNPSSQNITTLDQTADFAIMVNPTEGNPPNQISFAKLIINYDPAILSIDETGFVLNKSAFSTVLEGPTFSPGSILVILSVGADPSRAIKAQTKIADVKFKVLAKTDSTQITFANGTQVLSVLPADEAGENVIARTTPAIVSVVLAPTPTPGPTTGTINPNITCTELALDRSATGNAPYSITFTAAATITDGALTKATFNFGDGVVQDVTEGGGLGTNSVRVQKAYTYNNPGAYTATAIFTDNNNAVSSAVDNCKQTITVNTSVGGGPSPSPSATGSAETTPTVIPEEPTPTPTVTDSVTITQEPTPTIEPTGPSDNLIRIGIAGLIISIIGGVIFFML